MIKKIDRNIVRRKRAYRVRDKVSGTAERPRMCVYKGANLYAQIVDDNAGRTLVSSSSISRELKDKKLSANKESARIIGEEIAKKALGVGIKKVVFDRSGYAYSGVVAELADAARKAGLEF